MTVNFKLFDKKGNDKEKMSVVLMAFYNGKRFIYYTSEDCLVSQWDEKKQRFRKSYKGYFEANSYLDNLESETKNCYREYISKGIIPSPALLKDGITPKLQDTQKVLGFFELFDLFIIALKNRGNKESSIKHYRKMKNHLEAFSKVHKLEVNNYTEDVHNKFINFMMSKRDYHPNYLGNFNKYLKTFFNWCLDSQDIKLHPKHSKLKKTWIEPEKTFLTFNEVQKLIDIEVSGRLESVRDSFIFACMTGLRHSDLKGLSVEQIIDKGSFKVISLIPIKTQSRKLKSVKRIEVPLNEIAVNLLAKHADESKRKSLPVFSNQKMNEYLKELCKLAEINAQVETTIYIKGEPKTEFRPKYEKVTCHTARHTFATLALQRGLPIELVQKFLGHADLKTTMVYAKIVDEYKNKKLLEVWQF